MIDRSMDWDNDRLAAAFGARAQRAVAPSDLAAATIERVRGARRPSLWDGIRRRIVVGVSATAVVVAVAVIGLSRLTVEGGPAAGALERLGLTVMTVPEAIAVRDGGVDDREIAVRGWLGPLPAVPCQPVGRATVNPVQLECPHSYRWLTRDPEQPDWTRPPDGPAIQPAFPFLDLSALAPAPGSVQELVLVGHFDDRRATMCARIDRPACEDVFVVDRIVSVDDRPVESSTVLSLRRLEPGQVQPRRTAAEIDALIAGIAPNLEVASRLAIPGERIFEVEPALGTGALGIIDRQLVWVVTGLEPRAGQPPRLRTFILDDSQPEAFEGYVPIALPVSSDPAPTPTREPSPSSAADPSEVLGIPVVGVQAALDHRTRTLDDTELAVVGYLVMPQVIYDCRVESGSPIAPRCEDGDTWLVGDRAEPTATGGPIAEPRVNLVIRTGALIDLRISDLRSSPRVIVLGHFDDRRSCIGVMACRLQFVVDRIARVDSASDFESPALLTQAAQDTPADVAARVERDLGPARAGWLIATESASLSSIESEGAGLPNELTDAKVVWIARRLVSEEGRLVLRSAYTVDGSDQVWAERDGEGIDLATATDVAVGSADAGPVTAEVRDRNQILAGARPVDGDELREATWIARSNPAGSGAMEVADVPGRPGEIAVRWLGGACDVRWELNVYDHGNDPGRLGLLPVSLEQAATCDDLGIVRRLVLVFREPVRAADFDYLSLSGG